MEKNKRIKLILINLFLFIEMAVLMAIPLIEDTSYLTYCYQANVFVAVVALITVITNLKCLIKEKKTAKIESYSHPLAMLQLSSTVTIVVGAVATAVGTLVSMIMALVNDDQFFYYSIYGYYGDEDLFIHAINPVLAVLSFLLVRNECFGKEKFFDKKKTVCCMAAYMPLWCILYSAHTRHWYTG